MDYTKIIAFISIFFMIAGVAFTIGEHEYAHKAIFEDYGDKDASFGFDWKNKAVYTQGYCSDKECTFLQAFNEVLGYHVIALIVNLWVMLIVIFMAIIAWAKWKTED